jgi:uroporphyrinogen decarboxylase
MSAMNSKERVMVAVSREKPDRTPCNFHGTKVVCDRLFQHYALADYRDLMDVLGVDMIDIRGIVDPIWKGPIPKTIRLSNGVMQNYLGWQTKVVKTAYGPVEEHCGYIFANVNSLEQLVEVDFRWPQVGWFDFSHMSRELSKYKSYGIVASGASVFQHPTLVRKMDNLLADMLVAPEIANYLFDRFTDFYVEYFDTMFSQTKGQIDILRIADDLGMQDGPLISLELFQEFMSPRIRRLTEMAHSHGVKVMFHSCGSILQFIDELVDCGVDILDPIQTRAKDMEPERVKEKCRGRICMHGSVDTQYTLPMGTISEIEQEAKTRIEVLGDEGGFIIAPSHTLQPDVPLGNVIALYDAIRRYG